MAGDLHERLWAEMICPISRCNQCASLYVEDAGGGVSPLLAVCHKAALAPEEGGDPLVGRTAEWQVAQRALRRGTQKWHRGRSELALRSGVRLSRGNQVIDSNKRSRQLFHADRGRPCPREWVARARTRYNRVRLETGWSEVEVCVEEVADARDGATDAREGATNALDASTRKSPSKQGAATRTSGKG